jgi:hypothetical protein
MGSTLDTIEVTGTGIAEDGTTIAAGNVPIQKPTPRFLRREA